MRGRPFLRPPSMSDGVGNCTVMIVHPVRCQGRQKTGVSKTFLSLHVYSTPRHGLKKASETWSMIVARLALLLAARCAALPASDLSEALQPAATGGCTDDDTFSDENSLTCEDYIPHYCECRGHIALAAFSSYMLSVFCYRWLCWRGRLQHRDALAVRLLGSRCNF